MTSLSLDMTLPDDEVQRVVGAQAAREFLGEIQGDAGVEVGPLAVNRFSFTFSLAMPTRPGRDRLFVKIPKADLRGTAPHILPLSPEDRRMAREEEGSLRFLHENWPSETPGVRWIKLRGVIPTFNAIVTERESGTDAFITFRHHDVRRRVGSTRDARALRDLMARLGDALGCFHAAHARPTLFRPSAMLPKFEFYCRDLAASTGSRWPGRILDLVRTMDDSGLSSVHVPTHKGLDLRNILLDATNRLVLLDPGKTKWTHPEADIARFLMTYRILHWGSPLMLLLGVPDPQAEAAFLSAYLSKNRCSEKSILHLFFMKEQLKHWHTAIDSLKHRPWSRSAKRLAAGIYVHPFYERQISAQFLEMTGQRPT